MCVNFLLFSDINGNRYVKQCVQLNHAPVTETRMDWLREKLSKVQQRKENWLSLFYLLW